MKKENDSSRELKIVDILFNHSISRDDIKEIANIIPDQTEKDRQVYIYELQILKIISIGVSINYLLENSGSKEFIAESFWKSIFEFSDSVSSATGEFSDVKVDYFEVIRTKLDIYLKQLNNNRDAQEPASVIGPVFAEQCGNSGNTYAVLAGAKMFKSVVSGLRHFFTEEKFI